jgi:hypothetical protein
MKQNQFWKWHSTEKMSPKFKHFLNTLMIYIILSIKHYKDNELLEIIIEHSFILFIIIFLVDVVDSG